MKKRQRLLKMVYPVFNRFNKLTGKSTQIIKSKNMAVSSFYSLKADLNNGSILDFDKLKNKKVLIVNTASDCGFTQQYEGLQTFHEKYQEQVTVIGFPSNDFGEQEQANDETIANFCQVNFGVTFPLAKKAVVAKKQGQDEVYQWLTDENKNGWNYVAPTWNFCKYLIDEEGNLTHFFEAAIEPMGPEIIAAIENRDA